MLQSSHRKIVNAVLQEWPNHEKAIERNMKACSEDELQHADLVATMVANIAGDNLPKMVSGYQWMCKMIEDEELFFRRSGSYRNSSFRAVQHAVYDVPEVMMRYMDGLLLSQVLWSNHIRVGNFYQTRFIANASVGRRHLEIGTGHGLMLAQACAIAGVLCGWDISEDSIKITRECLKRIGVDFKASLICQDMFDSENSESFDDIVISEVLEHIENPASALEIVRDRLSDGGRVFINVPVNAPTIDHIYLFSSPEELIKLIESTGLIVEECLLAPAGGYSEARARKLNATISCAFIVRKVN